MGRIAASDLHVPRPVVKWAGGKAKLADRLRAWMPAQIGTYAEPFCGGAALFFSLAAEEKRRFARAILADRNPHLIATYRAIQTDVEALLERLVGLSEDHLARDADGREAHYYEVRDAEPPPKDVLGRAARLLFLNKTCFNGLWRVNSSGRNNVPYGRYAKPRIFDADALRAAHRALQGVELRLGDFADATAALGEGDFAYFDPPYVPVSPTANFTSYAANGFGPAEQERLAELLSELRERGVRAMLSNAWTPVTKKLYARFYCKPVTMPRFINSAADKRGDVTEVVVTTYPLTTVSRKKVAS